MCLFNLTVVYFQGYSDIGGNDTMNNKLTRINVYFAPLINVEMLEEIPKYTVSYLPSHQRSSNEIGITFAKLINCI